jgi:Bacterial Ig-like domain (group 3)/FG-GAP-like repeat
MASPCTSKVEVHRIVFRFSAILALSAVLTVLVIPVGAQVPAARQRNAASARSTNRAVQPNSSDSSLFLPAATYDPGGHATVFVAVADVNSDGKLDVVVANYCGSIPSGGTCGVSYEGTVGVLLGNGDGTFQPAVTYDSGGELTIGIAIADVNGDGKPDLIVANDCAPPYCGGSVSVLLGNGDGTFQPAVSYVTGGIDGVGAHSVAVADVNADGKPDLIVANWCADSNCDGSVGVLLGNGDGTFQKVVTYSSGGMYAEFVAISDVNGDGKPDLLVANGCVANSCDQGAVAVMLGNGDGTFRAPVQYHSGGVYPMSLSVVDVNGDGRLDVVTANNEKTGGGGGAEVGVLLGNGDGTFQPPTSYYAGGVPTYWFTAAAVADVNDDGKPDLVVASGCPSAANCQNEGVVGVLLGNGDGTFQPAMTFKSGGYLSGWIAVGDVNGDGLPDVLVASPCGIACAFFTWEEGSLAVLLNNSGSQNPTSTALASSPNPSAYGQTVTFTTTVTSSSRTPSGTVQLLYGSTVVGTGTLAGGKVSIPVSALPAGSDPITASYLGGGGFAASKSAAFTQTVTPSATTTSLSSSVNPSATNQLISFTATVTSQYGGAASGAVVFVAGSQTLGAVALGGNVATLTTSFANAGTYSITAQYNGDSNNIGSASASVSEKILASTATSLASSLNPSVVGQAVTFTATVSSSGGIPPNGETITFYNGSAVVGTAVLSGGAAALTTASLPAGIFTITARYPGDSTFAGSTSPGLRQVVNSTTKAATSTTLVSSLSPSIYGQKVIFTATVTTTGPLPPTGTVLLSWGNAFQRYTIGRAPLNSSGVATLAKSNLNADAYPVTAVFSGDLNNLGSTSPVLTQNVLQTTSAAAITSSVNPSTVGQAVTFTAHITSPTVVPAGPVTFKAGTTVLGTVQLSGGRATFTTSSLPAGSTTVKVTYNGDSNIKGSSALATQVVQP